jgi:hypothetical protein
MPYIPQNQRPYYTPSFPDNFRFIVPGELNFALTQVVNKYIKEHGACYTTFNDIVGALESCKLEFYRRVVGPYEDEKIIQNGDVYE